MTVTKKIKNLSISISFESVPQGKQQLSFEPGMNFAPCLAIFVAAQSKVGREKASCWSASAADKKGISIPVDFVCTVLLYKLMAQPVKLDNEL